MPRSEIGPAMGLQGSPGTRLDRIRDPHHYVTGNPVKGGFGRFHANSGRFRTGGRCATAAVSRSSGPTFPAGGIARSVLRPPPAIRSCLGSPRITKELRTSLRPRISCVVQPGREVSPGPGGARRRYWSTLLPGARTGLDHFPFKLWINIDPKVWSGHVWLAGDYQKAVEEIQGATVGSPRGPTGHPPQAGRAVRRRHSESYVEANPLKGSRCRRG